MISYFVCLAVLILVLTLAAFAIVRFINKFRRRKGGHKTLICGFIALVLFFVSFGLGIFWIFSYDKITSSMTLLLLTFIIITNTAALICAFSGIIKPNKTRVGKVFCVLVFVFDTLFIGYIIYSVNSFFNSNPPEEVKIEKPVS